MYMGLSYTLHGRNSSETQFLLIFFSLTRTSLHHPQQASRTDPKFARRKTETISLSLSLCVVAVASKDNNLTDLTFIDCVGRKKKVLSFSSACYTMWLIGFIIFPKCWQLLCANKTFLIHCTIYMEITNQEYVCALINNNTKYILVIIMTGQNMLLLIIIIGCMCVCVCVRWNREETPPAAMPQPTRIGSHRHIRICCWLCLSSYSPRTLPKHWRTFNS